MLPTSLSVASSSATGPQRSGDIGKSSFTFGGINTGTQNSPLIWIGVVAAVIAVFFLLRK